MKSLGFAPLRVVCILKNWWLENSIWNVASIELIDPVRACTCWSIYFCSSAVGTSPPTLSPGWAEEPCPPIWIWILPLLCYPAWFELWVPCPGCGLLKLTTNSGAGGTSNGPTLKLYSPDSPAWLVLSAIGWSCGTPILITYDTDPSECLTCVDFVLSPFYLGCGC